ncbi:MAG: TolC family protein [Bacteroidetes bacterium]|nr:TolC family protein [Bacteroidota bacterium]MBL7105439.1 TolC family protein [Bacteroidales bacterium]
MNINKVYMRQLNLLAVIFFIITSASSQEDIRKLTLDDAVKIARLQSPEALMAKHRFRASYWEYRSYRASYLPSLELDGTLPNFNRSIQRISVPEGELLSERQYAEYSVNAYIRQRIGFTGGQLFLRSGLERLDNFTDSSTITQYLSTPINIGYSQPIFKFNPFKWEKKLEPMKYEEAKKKYIEEMEQVSLTATNYFFNLFLAQIRQKIALVNLANYDTLYKIARGRFNLGKIAENDLLQLELQFLRANAAVDDVRLDVENRLFQFKSFLRIKDDIPIEIIPPSDMNPFKVEASKAIAEARSNNSDALAFVRRLLEAEREVNRAKMDGRFDAELYAVYGLMQSSIEFDQAYTNPLDQQQLSVGIKLPVLDWGVAKGKIKMAESNQELVRTSVEQEQIDFDQEIFLKVARFNMQYNQVKIAAKADTVAQKGYDITKARYMIGRISITDLNIAQTETDNSKSSYINALRTYWVNYYEIRQLTLYDFERKMLIMVDYRELL